MALGVGAARLGVARAPGRLRARPAADRRAQHRALVAGHRLRAARGGRVAGRRRRSHRSRVARASTVDLVGPGRTLFTGEPECLGRPRRARRVLRCGSTPSPRPPPRARDHGARRAHDPARRRPARLLAERRTLGDARRRRAHRDDAPAGVRPYPDAVSMNGRSLRKSCDDSSLFTSWTATRAPGLHVMRPA